MRSKKGFQANRVLSYFKAEWVTLATVTASGLIYNIGLLAAPWFEGRMAGRLVDILGGSGALPSMLRLGPSAMQPSPRWCRAHVILSAFMCAALPMM